MLLPTASPAVSKWTLWDYVKKSASSPTVAVNGVCVAQLAAVPDNELWFVDRLRVSCDSTAPTVALVYSGQIDDDYVEDGTLTGNFDVADYASPLALLPTEQLTVQWTGATGGAAGRLRAQITVMRLAGTY